MVDETERRLKKVVFFEGFDCGTHEKPPRMLIAKVIGIRGWQNVFNCGLMLGKYAKDNGVKNG